MVWTECLRSVYAGIVRPCLKVGGNLVVFAILAVPIWMPGQRGLASELTMVGVPVAVGLATVFFGAVALYCRTLQRCLTLTRYEARVVSPLSVWWMWAIPYNFVEDFFIIDNIARSWRRDARIDTGRLRLWTVLGFTWATLQVLTICPAPVAWVATLPALIVWAWHWMFSVRILRSLTSDGLANAVGSTAAAGLPVKQTTSA